MANLRILFNNVAKTSTLTATSAVLPVSNLLTDVKSSVWRSSTTTETLTLTWTATQTINMVALPFCGLSSTATIQVKGYTNATDSTPVFTSATQVAAPGSLNQNLGMASYGYGGGTYAYIYFSNISVKKLTITIVDSASTLGYIEAATLVVGQYYEFAVNPEYANGQNGNITLTQNEGSTFVRSDAGDQRIDRASIYRTLTMALPWMIQSDRNFIWQMLRTSGMYAPIFVSTVPQSTDTTEEFIYCVYGRLSKAAGIQYYFMNQFSTTLEIEEI